MDNIRLKKMVAADGGLNMDFEGGAMQLVAEAFGDQFVQSGATNFLEMTFTHDKVGELCVTMQRAGAITPAGKVAKMKELIRAGDLDAALAV